MVNEDKIRIMTRLASFEKKMGEDELKKASYYQSDYIRAHLLVTIWSYTMGYILVVGLFALYYLDYLTSVASFADMRNLGMATLAIYILIMAGCVFFSISYSSRKYVKLRRKLREYEEMLVELSVYYDQGKEGNNE